MSINLESQPFDREKLLKEYTEFKSGLCDMISQFLMEAPHLLNELEKAMRDKDSDKLKFMGHRIKSSTSYFFAGPTFKYADQLEHLNKTLDWNDVHKISDHLIRELNRLVVALKEELKTQTMHSS